MTVFCNSSSLFFDLLYYFSLSSSSLSSSSSSSYDHHRRHRHDDDDDDYYYYKKGEPTSHLSLFWGTYSTLGELNLTLRLNVSRLKDIYFNNIFFRHVCRVDINNGATELAKNFRIHWPVRVRHRIMKTWKVPLLLPHLRTNTSYIMS